MKKKSLPTRRGKPFQSVIQSFECEILTMWDAGRGVSLREVQAFLLSNNIKVSISTIWSFLDRRKSAYLKTLQKSKTTKIRKSKSNEVDNSYSTEKIKNAEWDFSGNLKRRYEEGEGQVK